MLDKYYEVCYEGNMNCYRCGYNYSGSECLVCGKQSPTDDDPIGGDSDLLRIALIVPDLLSENHIDRLIKDSDHYQLDMTAAQRKHIFVYTPTKASALFEALSITEGVRERSILFNGRQRPHDTELWLPLLWFLA